MAVPVRLELLAATAGLEQRRRNALARVLAQRGQRLRDLARGLPRPEALLAERAQRLDGLALRLPLALVAFTRELHLALSRGAAGRFGPALLALGLEQRRQRLSALSSASRRDAMAAAARPLSCGSAARRRPLRRRRCSPRPLPSAARARRADRPAAPRRCAAPSPGPRG